jgi:hypothetical protein
MKSKISRYIFSFYYKNGRSASYEVTKDTRKFMLEDINGSSSSDIIMRFKEVTGRIVYIYFNSIETVEIVRSEGGKSLPLSLKDLGFQTVPVDTPKTEKKVKKFKENEFLIKPDDKL